MIATRSGRHTKPVPGCDTIKLQLPPRPTLLERLESRPQPRVKLFFRNRPELRFRIVDVINIHTIQIHITKRLLQLVLQIRRRHAMTAAHYILETRYAGFDKCFLNVSSQVTRGCTVKWQVATLGTNDYFVSRKAF